MDGAPTTPGVGGYVLVVVVSVLTVTTVYVAGAALVVAASGGASLEVLVAVLSVWAWSTGIGLLVATPLALVGVPLVHLLARRHRPQRTHVLLAGLVSFALVVVAFVVADPRQFGGDPRVPMALATPVALAAMLGRAAVVPLVRRRGAAPPERRRTP